MAACNIWSKDKVGAGICDVVKGDMVMEKHPKLLDQLRYALRLKHRRLSTEKAYVNWVKRFMLYHNKMYRPQSLGQ